MARAEVAELLRRIGETALAWRAACDATEAGALVATYHGLLREMGARGPDADALGPMGTVPDVLLPPGWRTEEPPAPPHVPRDNDRRSAQPRDAYAEALRRHDTAAHAAAHS